MSRMDFHGIRGIHALHGPDMSRPHFGDDPEHIIITRVWPMLNVMAAVPNIGGALCSAPQSLADAHYSSAVQ